MAWHKCARDTALQIGHNVAEGIADHRAQQQENGNYNNRYQNKYQRILNQTLPLFIAKLQHQNHLLSYSKFTATQVLLRRKWGE